VEFGLNCFQTTSNTLLFLNDQCPALSQLKRKAWAYINLKEMLILPSKLVAGLLVLNRGVFYYIKRDKEAACSAEEALTFYFSYKRN
jgi:hypothetical protein